MIRVLVFCLIVVITSSYSVASVKDSLEKQIAFQNLHKKSSGQTSSMGQTALGALATGISSCSYEFSLKYHRDFLEYVSANEQSVSASSSFRALLITAAELEDNILSLNRISMAINSGEITDMDTALEMLDNVCEELPYSMHTILAQMPPYEREFFCDITYKTYSDVVKKLQEIMELYR